MRVRNFGDEGVCVEQPQPPCDSGSGFLAGIGPFGRFRPEFLQITIADSLNDKSAVLQESEFACVLRADGTQPAVTLPLLHARAADRVQNLPTRLRNLGEAKCLQIAPICG